MMMMMQKKTPQHRLNNPNVNLPSVPFQTENPFSLPSPQTRDVSVVVVPTAGTLPTGISIPFSPRCISAANVLCGFHLREVRGVLSSSILSTCSSVRPFVSGTKK